MLNTNYDQLFRMGKNFNLPFNEWSKAAAAISQRVMAHNLGIIGEQCSLVSDQLNRLTTIKKPEELLNMQKEFLSENLSLGLKSAKETMALSLENVDELTKLWSTTAAKVTEQAVEKAKKYAEKSEK